MEIKLDRKKNHIAASDYKEQTTVIKTTSDFKIGNNVDTNKIEGNYMVKREKETLIKIIELRKSNCLFYKHLIFMYFCPIINF